jgi:putative sterol carrier protein
MPHEFLSDDWFEAFDAIRDEAPAPPAAAADLVLNLVVTGAPNGDLQMHTKGGQFDRGHADGAPTKLTMPYETAKSLFVKGDQQAAMQAFMTGQIKVEGDMSKLMAMQAGGGPTPEQIAFQKKLQEMTA